MTLKGIKELLSVNIVFTAEKTSNSKIEGKKDVFK